MCAVFLYFNSHIRLPVLPNGLQIMADQGFANIRPLLVMPRAQYPGVDEIMRELVKIEIFKRNLFYFYK